jgi:hypothetical protein
MYVQKASETTYKNQTAVTMQEAKASSGPSATIPKDSILFVVYKSEAKGEDELTIINGATGATTNLQVNLDGLDRVLTTYAPLLKSTATVDIGLYEPKKRVNPAIVLNIQRWLVTNGCDHYHFYFSK